MKREEQYTRKIEYIFSCLDKMTHPESEKEVYALFYLVHTSIEAAMDIVAMLVKDLGGVPKDDYENIAQLRDRGVVSAELAENLKKLNGLRNILVRRYNKVEESIVIEGLEDIKVSLEKFVEVVEDALKRVF
jgi:uncharacterized protein YutE (UPF0331/DUF86 family)